MNQDTARQIASLKEMMTWPCKHRINDILQRRIYALEQDIVYTNPFDDVDETLYALWRKPPPPPIERAIILPEIDWDDFL